MVHILKTFEDVVEFNESSMVTKEELDKTYEETPEQKEKRLAENKANIERIKQRLDRKKYNKMTENIQGFRNNADMMQRIEKAET